MYAISTNNLTKSYKMLTAVDNVSVTVQRGSITGLVGKNGAGKTTLMRMLASLIKPTSGTYSILGNNAPIGSVSAIIETPSLYGGMTVMDNLIMQSKILGMTVDKEYLYQLLELVDLANFCRQKATFLSLGMKQRLSIAMCLVGKPQLLLLDEPTNGLDPQGIKEMRELFVKINTTMGITILISSHILDELAKFATHYIFMDKGKVIKSIKAEEMTTETTVSTKLVVSDIQSTVAILKELGYNGKVFGSHIEIQGKVEGTDLLIALANKGIKVSSMTTVGGSLEDFYLTLMGGNDNV